MSRFGNELVLVTGATGFIGASVTLELIKQGYKVRGTTRSQSKADAFLAKHPFTLSSLTWAIIPDMSIPDAFDTVFEAVDHVIHVAAPVNRAWKPFEKDLIDQAVQGTKNMLEAALKQKTVKTVVMTSSSAAVIDHRLNPRAGYTYTEKDWSPLTWEDVKGPGDIAYVVSKKLSERAAWDFIQTRSPHFSLTTFCPPLVFGPPMQPVDSMAKLNTSAGDVWALMDGSTKGSEIPPAFIFTWVDVRDVAKLHVQALSNPKGANQRYLTVAGHYSNHQIAHVLAQTYPSLAQTGRIPACDNEPPPAHFGTDSRKAEADFEMEWIGFEQCVRDTAGALLELEKETMA